MIRFIIIVSLVILKYESVQPSGPTLKLVDGSGTSITNYPFIVYLHVYNVYECIGVILNAFYILTAAHCVSYQAKDMYVRVGSTYPDDGKVHYIHSYYLHSTFSRSNKKHDIAILKLENMLEMSKSVAPVRLPGPDEEISSGMKGTAIGFSSNNGDEDTWTKKLSHKNLIILAKDDCEMAYGSEVFERQFCTVFFKDSHKFSSGGSPIIVKKQLYGILSKGYGSQDEYQPSQLGIYVMVAEYMKFINSVLSKC